MKIPDNDTLTILFFLAKIADGSLTDAQAMQRVKNVYRNVSLFFKSIDERELVMTSQDIAADDARKQNDELQRKQSIANALKKELQEFKSIDPEKFKDRIEHIKKILPSYEN